MIYYFTPYDTQGGYGRACNECCQMVPQGAWICILDGDTMFMGEKYGHQIEQIIQKYPDVALFTCVTNRIGNRAQQEPGMMDITSIPHHRIKAQQLQRDHWADIRYLKNVISGHLMLFNKDTWAAVGGFKEQGILGVDNDFSRKILHRGGKIALMMGVYLLHYYRMNEGITYKAHLR